MRVFRWALPLAVIISVACASAQANDFGEVVVVTHIDVIPTFLDNAKPLIEDFVLTSRNDPGVKQFILVSWDDITNHFQLIERFLNMKALDLHVSAKHTIEFRNALQSYIGAPYDERLYSAGQ